MVKKQDDTSIKSLVEDYINIIFKILAVFPFNYTLIKKFISGKFERNDYNINFLTNFKDYLKIFFIYLISLVIGLWWVFILGPMLVILLLAFSIDLITLILITIVGLILIFIISLVIGFIYLYLKSLLYKIVINYFGGDLSFNEAGTLVIYSSILVFIFSIPIILSYSVFIGFIFSIIISILPFYALYFIRKELVSKFGMESDKALYSVIISFVIEYLLFSIPGIILYLLMFIARMMY